MKGKKEKRVSNLVTDPELAERFQREIKAISEVYLKQRYFTLSELTTPEDVVIECWVKVLREGIIYDSSRSALSTFSRIIVNGVCRDMWRKYERHSGLLSLDYEFDNNSGDEAVNVVDSVRDKRYEFEDLISTESILDECCEQFNDIDLRAVIENRKEGLRDGVQARKEGIRVKDMRKFLDSVEEIVNDRRNNCDRTLADILYGDEEELMKQRDKLEFTLSFIKDDRKRFSLGDVVRKVIDGLTYKEIADDFGVSSDEVKGFLDKYQLMVI